MTRIKSRSQILIQDPQGARKLKASETEESTLAKSQREEDMSKRREFVLKLVPLAGALAVLPRIALADVPVLSEDDKMASALGFRLQTEKVDSAKFPKHSNDQTCAKCLHYTTAAADTARCDLFNKIVPKGGWCSGFSKRP